jgi:predicted dehydrogenase
MHRDHRVNRRQFVRGASAAAALFTIIPRHVLGSPDAPGANDKLNIAGVGTGGQGWGVLQQYRNENIVALCDVDDQRAADAFKTLPDARRFRDFRKMFDAMEKQIDAVVVGTPDHTHAVICMDAMKRKKHVFCEKPLAHSVYEIRKLMDAARESGVVTQLGNQGHSSPTIRSFCEWIWDGAIGQVQEIHACCDAFKDVYSQIRNLPRRAERHDVPGHLDWDLWLGPAAFRAYHPMYVPWNWRGWTPFGTGCIGDWICHVVDPVFWALDLGAPVSVQADADEYDPVEHAEVYPPGTAITFEFAAKGDRGPVKLVWFDGNRRPPHPKDLEEGRNPPGVGAVVIGDRGTITYGSHGAGGVRIVPEAKMQEYQTPEPTLPRVPGHYVDWTNAIREGRPAGSDFSYGGPLTELGLLGMIAVRLAGTKLLWDGPNMRFTNSDQANRWINPPARSGWEI